MNTNYVVDEAIGMIEGACLAIEEHGWLCSDYKKYCLKELKK